MAKNEKQRLFEIMSRIDSSYKPNLNENFDLSQQQILNDILGMNENPTDWWNKFIQYGKKGLLTASIVLALSMSSYATSDEKKLDVINMGLEMLDSDERMNMINFLIGYSTEVLRKNMRERHLDQKTSDAYYSLNSYLMFIRRTGRSFSLSDLRTPEQQETVKSILAERGGMDLNRINDYIELGKASN